MASRKILVQLDIQAASSLTSPLSGFVGFSAKADGLYQKIGTAPELRLLTSADVQNAILADGSITGAVSQAQIFTIGVKLYNLTQGYIPYASGATKLLSNSPIYTDGTNVGIGTTTPGKKLSVGLAASVNGVDGDILSSALATGTGYGSSMIWNMYVAGGNANSILAKIQPSIYQPTRSYLNSLDFFVGDWNNNNDAGTSRMTIQSGGNVGIGTPAPNQQLEITKNFRLPSTAGTTPYGIIYKDGNRFIHDFNYGNNGTVTTSGGNTFVGINAGNFTMGSTATSAGDASYNTGIGYQSLYANTTGNSNTANGYQSLRSNTTGSSNSAFGHQSLFSNTTGSNNVAIGYNSLIFNTTGYYNTALGVNSLFANTTGNNNTAFGCQSLIANITGSSNSVLGYNAGRYIANGTTGRTTGNNGLYLGTHTKASADGTDNEIVIGYNAIGAGSNKTVIGNSSVTDTYFGSSTGSSKLWASALNLSSLTASKVVFTDGSKNLTSTGIGTASQFIKGDGSLDSNTYIISGSISGFVPYTGANDNVNLGTHDLSCNKISAASKLTVGNINNSSYTDGGYLSVTTPSSGYASLNFYSKDTSDGFGIVQINANPEEGIMLTAKANDNSMNSSLIMRALDLGLYTNSLKRLEITQNGSINAFGNTITSTGGFIGNASTATKLQTARTITIGNQSLPFDGTENISYTLSGIGIPVGTASQYFRGDLSLATFPTIHTGSGFNGGVTFWSGANSLSAAGELTWNNTTKNLSVTGGVSSSNVSSNSMSTNSLSTNSFKLGSSTTAGYVLTTDAVGNGTWQASPTGGGSYTLPTATASVLGGVKIGSGITISSGVISVSTNYQAPITTGTTSQYLRGDLSLATFPTIHTGSGVDGRITFWNGTNSLSSNSNLTWDNTNSRLSVNSISLASSFKLGASSTTGYVLTTDANGNGTWQAPTGASYTLPTASASVLGGVKIGSGITISSGVISVSTNYQAPITTGTTSQYLRGDLSLATFPTIHTGSGFNGGVTFWDGANSLSAAGELTWNNTSKNLVVTGGVSANNVSSNSMSTNSLSTNSFRLIATTTAGYVLTTDANGNGTWQASPTGGGSYTLPTATASVLGGVKIGSGIAISSGVISVSTNYEAPLTFTNGLSRAGNTVSFSGSSSYVPYTGATSNVNIGSYVMYANNFILNSDINLKCNIESIEIKNIDIDYKKYEFKSLVGDIRYGVIAQELLKVAPELVSSTPNNTFSVKYIDLLIHEIAYLKQEIKKLTGGN